jgi:PIN domain nuclease of toxin-antitoxin system
MRPARAAKAGCLERARLDGIAIKRSLGKLRAPADVGQAAKDAGFTATLLGFADAAVLESLPWHHTDPFDRLLVAHAMAAGSRS